MIYLDEKFWYLDAKHELWTDLIQSLDISLAHDQPLRTIVDHGPEFVTSIKSRIQLRDRTLTDEELMACVAACPGVYHHLSKLWKIKLEPEISDLRHTHKIETESIRRLSGLIKKYPLGVNTGICITKIYLKGEGRPITTWSDLFTLTELVQQNGIRAVAKTSGKNTSQRVARGTNPLQVRAKGQDMIAFGITPMQNHDLILYVYPKEGGSCDISANYHGDGSKLDECLDFLNIPKMIHMGNWSETSIKFTISGEISTPWNEVVLCELITNCQELSYHLAVSETNGVQTSSRSVTVNILTSTWSKTKISSTVRYSPEKKVLFVCRHAKNNLDVIICAYLVNLVCKLYDKHSSEIISRYEDMCGWSSSSRKLEYAHRFSKTRINTLDQLRSCVPELFVNNYSRECPILPVLIPEDEAQNLAEAGVRVILYPLPYDPKVSRYYTAPDEYFVGLKKNRLPNRNMFTHLITCYDKDHMLRKSSETYIYYHAKKSLGEDGSGKSTNKVISSLRSLARDKLGPLPNKLLSVLNIGSREYNRIGVTEGTSSLLGAVLFSMGCGSDLSDEYLSKLREGLDTTYLSVVSQDIPNISLDKAARLLTDARYILEARYFYKYFEDLYGVDIIIIDLHKSAKQWTISSETSEWVRAKDNLAVEHYQHDDNASLTPWTGIWVPNHGKYLWQRGYQKGMIIFRNQTRLYQEIRVSYEPVVRSDGETLFGMDDELYRAIINHKQDMIRQPVCPPSWFIPERMSISDMVSSGKLLSQYINEDGICAVLEFSDGTLVESCCPPIWGLPTIKEPPWKPLTDHLEEMNEIRRGLGLEPEIWYTCDKHVVYLPNHESVEKYKLWLWTRTHGPI